MKSMNKAFALALAALLLMLPAGCGQPPAPSGAGSSGTTSSEAVDDSLQKILDAGVVVVGTSPDFAPSEFLDLSKEGQEQFVGSEMTLARYIAAELGVELEIKAMDFATVTAAVDQGTVDLGISGFSRTEERAASYEVSDPPHNRSGSYQGIMIRKADAELYTSLDDFNKAEVLIGAQNGSLQLQLVQEQLPNCEIKLVGTVGEGIMMLQSGAIDALGMAGTSGEGYAQNYDDVIMCDIHYDWESPGTVVLMKKGNLALKAAIDEITQKVVDEDLFPGWLADAQALALSLGAEAQ